MHALLVLALLASLSASPELPFGQPGAEGEEGIGPPPGGAGDESEELRIQIDSGRGALALFGTDLSLSTPQTLDALRLPGGRVDVRCGPSGLQANRMPLDQPVSALAKGPLRLLGRTLRGRIELSCDRDRWTAINVLPIETYLGAVLGGEMPVSFPPAALEAQAVAARSYALMRKNEAREQGKPFHVGATVLSQVYRGLSHEDPHTLAAVAATHGEVLALGVTPVEAYFHASCGGRTEGGGPALGRSLPYLVPVSCPDSDGGAGHSPWAHWRVDFSAADLGRTVGFGPAEDIEVVSRSSTGRAGRVRIQSTKSGVRTLSAVQLRAALGYDKLPSLWFDVHREGKRFVFEGRGSGHGAGLCQWGAKVLADQGKTYRDILAHYYPGTTVLRIY